MRKSLFRIVISTLLLFALACLGWMGVQEYRALGFLKWNIGRSFFVERTVGGRITELYYRIVNAGEDPVEIAAGRAFTVICIAFAALLILRLFWLFVFSGPRESRRIRTILAPLNDLALKADELSRMEFGEDKYHVIEDAISQLDADERCRL